MKKFRTAVLLVILFIISGYTEGQMLNFKAPLDKDPELRTGKLDNGLVYYIRNNHKPENRVYLWLAVKAGSTYENDDQQGLAHFVEHMAFNGTKNFKKNELIDVLEKMGIKFGAELNAHTAFNETVYKLQVPTDKPELVEKGFLVLEDWAHNLSFDDNEIDKERGVITEEWRLGLGADDRMRKTYLPILLKGSRYASRLPIGEIDIIKNFKHETLRQYYRDWYRPNLMAVVVVGDIDVNVAEQKIKQHFSGLKNPLKERPAEEYDIPDNAEPLIAIASDAEATNSYVQVLYKRNKLTETTIGDYRSLLLHYLFTSMLNKRFEEIINKPEAPFIYAGANYSPFLANTKDAFSLKAEL
jgi:zinc protease